MANPWKISEKTIKLTEKYVRFFRSGDKEKKMPENREFLQKKTGRKKRTYFSVSFVMGSLTKNNTLCKGEKFREVSRPHFFCPSRESGNLPRLRSILPVPAHHFLHALIPRLGGVSAPADGVGCVSTIPALSFVIPAQAGIGSMKFHKEMNWTKAWRISKSPL
jgi:hypothetical protein